ncbi:hypothetical protein HJC23_000710 [Cyclotella cryptica]|uniref:Peptidase S26 domain-containing protein n=1 Tax=Cyclotella cryptica TaxID=29204 RepID=A0ABD3QA90_9STRA|eukprot:CCRYP_007403-RA/>CCRYP_007403-RA protein AED:0.21 eAED:0.13 QI:0/-1/0/1/-1/1/1/0/385
MAATAITTSALKATAEIGTLRMFSTHKNVLFRCTRTHTHRRSRHGLPTRQLCFRQPDNNRCDFSPSSSLESNASMSKNGLGSCSLSRKYAIGWNNSTSAFVRSMSSSAKPDQPPPSHSFLQRIFIELQYLIRSIRQLTLEEIRLFSLRIVAFIGSVHITAEYGFKTFTCEGPSMEPTIIDHSYTLVLVDRWSHRLFGLESGYDSDSGKYEHRTARDGIAVSEEVDNLREFKEALFSVLNGIWKQHFKSGLQRGDVIILKHPLREGTLCKRIIGLPGDIIVRTDGGSEESHHRVSVPPGHFWIEGDNTSASADSRSYGAIPASLTVGKVICRLWPLRDYAWLGMDANGMHQWKRIDARIGRGERPMPVDGSEFLGSHVLGIRRSNV